MLHFALTFFSALDKIIVQGYKALQLMYFFTSGPDEVKAWTIQVSFLIQQKFLLHPLGKPKLKMGRQY